MEIAQDGSLFDQNANTKLYYFRHFFACGVYVQSKKTPNNSLINICYHHSKFAIPMRLQQIGSDSTHFLDWLIIFI